VVPVQGRVVQGARLLGVGQARSESGDL
jgi:hypothetical protein